MLLRLQISKLITMLKYIFKAKRDSNLLSLFFFAYFSSPFTKGVVIYGFGYRYLTRDAYLECNQNG